MRYLVAVLAWTMPVVAFFSNAGAFGPTNAAISNRYPTLIVAAGYAFTIWGPIFALDVVYGTLQCTSRQPDKQLVRVRPWTAFAFALTSLWMVVFSLQWFELALAIIWASLVCLLVAAWRFSDTACHARGRWWQWIPLSLHAGWVSLAAFLNVAQVVVAFHWLPITAMLPWTLILFALVAVLLLVMVDRMRGNPWYALAAVWGLIGVYIKQHGSNLAGAEVAARAALALAFATSVLSLWHIAMRRRVASAPRLN